MAALAVTATTAVSSQSRSAFVLGTVVDAATNRPIPGAIVTIARQTTDVTADPSPQPAGSARGASRLQADAQGRFVFRGLAPGTFVFTASASGYLAGGYGQRRPGAATQPFTVGENTRAGDVTIRLWPEASIAGRVVDENGDPIVGVWVHIAHRETAGGRPRLTAPRSTSAYTSQTDDRGAYHFRNLSPGTYVVSVPSRLTTMPIAMANADKGTLTALAAGGSSALSMGMSAMSPGVRLGDFVVQTSNQGQAGASNALIGRLPFSPLPDGRFIGYPTTFHPSQASGSMAIPIAVKAGESRTDVDVQLRPVEMQRLTGSVVGPNGPEAHLAVHLFASDVAGGALERTHAVAIAPTDARGSFTFPAVPPGDYVAKAWRLPPALGIGTDPLPAEPTLWGETPIVIGTTAPPSLSINLQPGVTLNGRFEFEGTAKPPRPPQLQPTLAGAFEPPWPSAYTRLLAARVNEKFEFTTQGVPPGRYFADFASGRFAPQGWYLESATLDGKDLFTTPLMLGAQNLSSIVLRYSDRRSMLSGVVTDASGKPDSSAMVIVLPADHHAWMQNGMPAGAVQTAPVTQSGEYSVASVRPGEHLVAAIPAEQFDTWREPAVVERVTSRASTVNVARGENRRVDLKVIK